MVNVLWAERKTPIFYYESVWRLAYVHVCISIPVTTSTVTPRLTLMHTHGRTDGDPIARTHATVAATLSCVRGPQASSQAVRCLLNPGRTDAPSFSYGGVGRPPRSKLAQNIVEGKIQNGRMVREVVGRMAVCCQHVGNL